MVKESMSVWPYRGFNPQNGTKAAPVKQEIQTLLAAIPRLLSGKFWATVGQLVANRWPIVGNLSGLLFQKVIQRSQQLVALRIGANGNAQKIFNAWFGKMANQHRSLA